MKNQTLLKRLEKTLANKQNNAQRSTAKAKRRRRQQIAMKRQLTPVSAAPVAMSAFPSVYHEIVSRKTSGVVIRGRDRLNTLAIGTSNLFYSPGTVMSETYLAPQTWANTWIQRQSDLYERFRFHRARLIVAPNAASSQAGSLLYCYDNNSWDDAPASLTQASHYANAQVVSLWQPASMDIPLNMVPQQNPFYTDNLEPTEASYKTCSQGTLYTLWNAVPGSVAGIALPTLFIEYELEFFVPSLEVQYRSYVTTASLGAAANGDIAFTGITAANLISAGIALDSDVTVPRSAYATLRPYPNDGGADRTAAFGLIPGENLVAYFGETGANTGNFIANITRQFLPNLTNNYLKNPAGSGVVSGVSTVVELLRMLTG